MTRAAPLSAALAAVIGFAAAFGVGMATKSSSSPQPATSLASPVAVPADRASLPALEKAMPTPAFKPRPAPPRRPKSTTTSAPATPLPASPPTVARTPTVIHTPSPPPPPRTPTTGVVHNPGGSTSNGGGSGVVHGGQ